MNNPLSPLLEVRDLTKKFTLNHHEIEVLRGINLKVMEGEFLSIMGASGVGKSTFLHLLGALDAPTSGEVIFEGKKIDPSNETALADFRNKKVGFVFQFHHLLPEFTALENAAMPAMIQGLSRREAFNMAREMLEDVGLGKRTEHKPGELSGGEQQRVAVARALLLHPALILADEPTGNLDSRTSMEIFHLLRRINQEKKVTFILVTHNEKIAVHGDRLLEMVDGMIKENKKGS
ncbi:MAG: ABC transporter ATP-binding protein [Nitrospirae bacterium]|nr:ABC transporter ATP-binding protein [Nitrospirota bacterium]MBI3352263.1 ABC transporter ATP-binding protein [Nitrospirota bacterium]